MIGILAFIALTSVSMLLSYWVLRPVRMLAVQMDSIFHQGTNIAASCLPQRRNRKAPAKLRTAAGASEKSGNRAYPDGKTAV